MILRMMIVRTMIPRTMTSPMMISPMMTSRATTRITTSMPRTFSLAVALLLAPVYAPAQAQNSAPPARDASVYAELTKAPKKAAARRNPLATDPDAAAAGSKLFELHCAECHGVLALGGSKGPSLRTDEVEQATPGTLFWLLTNGVVRRGMPVWSKLPEPQRWQLVSYIKSLTPAAQPSAQSPPPQ